MINDGLEQESILVSAVQLPYMLVLLFHYFLLVSGTGGNVSGTSRES